MCNWRYDVMQFKTFYFNPLRECCYVLWDQTGECVIIDPGCFGRREFARLEKFVEENSLTPVKVLLTHGHFDHVMGLADLTAKWNIPVLLHRADFVHLELAQRQCAMYGMDIENPVVETVDIADGEQIVFGETMLDVIATPGHTQGGVCYHCPSDGLLFCGDTLFEGSIGRTDLPGGNYDQLMASIRTRLMILPRDTKIFPGHGFPTTIAEEAASNPYINS